MKQFSNFNLHLYTEIVFGKGTEAQAGQLVKKHGGTKVLMVYGGGSIKKIGLYDRVAQSLNDAGVPFVELPGVQPNPRRSHADKGAALARAEGVDFILAVGGGSTLDTAKAIGYALEYDGDWWDFYSGKARPQAMAPVGSIHHRRRQRDEHGHRHP
jgi:alcohol dehydrogenase YqhD (iron-dependent ADH family)